MESIEHNFGIGVGHVLPDGCTIRLPHVHRNCLDRRARLEGEVSEIRVQVLRGAIIGDVEHYLLVEIDDLDEREVPQIGMLIDTESPAGDVRPAREAAAHHALDNAVGFFPREAESARYHEWRRFLQPRDCQPLKEERELRALLGPWHLDCAHPMRRAADSLDRRVEQRLELARLQMAPAPLGVVVDRARHAALGTNEPCANARCHARRAGRRRGCRQHESDGKLLGQCRGGELLRDAGA